MKPPVLALKNVRLADGPRMLFDGVDLALEPRSRAALVGRNGAGKSTLMRILAGLTEADDGERAAYLDAFEARVLELAAKPIDRSLAVDNPLELVSDGAWAQAR